MMPIQARNEPLMYKMAMLSGMLPNVEPSNHALLLKQMELHQKLGDFSKIRERRVQRDTQLNAHLETERMKEVMNRRIPLLRGAEGQAQQREQVARAGPWVLNADGDMERHIDWDAEDPDL
jgi:hypothetical protein